MIFRCGHMTSFLYTLVSAHLGVERAPFRRSSSAPSGVQFSTWNLTRLLTRGTELEPFTPRTDHLQIDNLQIDHIDHPES